MSGPDFGDTVTGTVADENDWTGAGPRPATPRRVVTGVVVGLYPGTGTAVSVRTTAGDVVCVRVISRRPCGPA
jgi:predicted RNase H-like nuclease (RuvC/YqgF family)